MTVEEKVQAVLLAASGVTALVGNRIAAGQSVGQDVPTPYIRHFPVTAVPTHVYGSLAAMRQWPFYQVSVFGESYGETKAVAEQVRALMGQGLFTDVQTFWRDERNFFEEDTLIHQIAQDYEIWEAL